jgi:hypothetical protein
MISYVFFVLVIVAHGVSINSKFLFSGPKWNTGPLQPLKKIAEKKCNETVFGIVKVARYTRFLKKI